MVSSWSCDIVWCHSCRESVVIGQFFPWHYPAGSEVEQVLRLERKCVSLLFFNTGYNCLLGVGEFLLFFVSVWLVLLWDLLLFYG